MASALLFHETQRFRQPLLWMVLVPVMLIPAFILGYGMIQQLAWNEPWGGAGTTDAFLILVGPLMIGATGAALWVVATARLTVTVHPEALTVRLHPFAANTIETGRIASCRVVAYRPLWEYAGWGVRRSPGTTAYTVAGNCGVELVLVDGARILVGSQKPEHLAGVLTAPHTQS